MQHSNIHTIYKIDGTPLATNRYMKMGEKISTLQSI
jgi:hypothetical protein